MKMYKKEIDEIYELCKRVANEVPTANASFNYSIYGMSVCGLRRKMLIFPKTNLNGICIRVYLLIHFTRKRVVKVSK
jgi:hypothetical protein